MRLMVCSARSPFPDVALRIVSELSLTNAMAFQRDYGMRKGSQPSPLVRREMNGVILVLEVCPLCDGQDAGIVQLAGRTRRCPYRRSRADRRDCVSAWAARKCRSGLRVEPIWTRRSRRRGDGGMLSSPSPFQLFAFDLPNELVSVFPLVLVPVFLVPVSVLLHLASLVKASSHSWRY